MFKNMLEKNWKIFLYLLTIIFFSFMICSIFYSLSKTYKVSIIAESDHADTVKLYFSNSLFSPKFQEENSVSQNIPPNKKTTINFNVPGLPTASFRIDPGEQAGKIDIYKIIITQDLGKETILYPDDIYSDFYCIDENIKMTLSNKFVNLLYTAEDPQIISNNNLFKFPFPVLVLFPVSLLTFLFYKIISRYPAEYFFSFFFPHRKKPSNNESVIEPLDGLRGFATLLVIAEHTWHPFLGAGHSGVMIFFALSGFLLTRPFINSPEKILNVTWVSQYLQRRIERILPLYLVYLFLVYGMSLRLGDFILHAFFIKGLGHLWTLPQEMLFYTLLPIFLFINYFILRNNLFLITIFLFSIIFDWYSLVSTQYIYLYGEFYAKLPFMLPSFISGTAFSYLYYKIFKNLNLSQLTKVILTIFSFIIIITFIFFSNAQLFNSSEIYAFTYRTQFGVCAALLIVTLLLLKDSFLVKIFSNPFLCSIGVVSYSIYLFHPLVINFVNIIHVTGGLRFFATLFVTYFIACFTYHSIEVPFWKKTYNQVSGGCSPPASATKQGQNS